MPLLIATDTLEEGIDVPDCEFVIRFNWIGTTKSHIQGSGRARKQSSICYYFENDGRLEQQRAELLNDVARDRELALTENARALHHDSPSNLSLSRTPGYPYRPEGEAEVNLSNAGKILKEYCTVVLQQMVSPKSLCTFDVEEIQHSPQQRRKTIRNLSYPTPEGWHKVSKDEESDSNEIFVACSTEVFRRPRYKDLNTREKDIKCFAYVAVVELRKQGLLDSANKPSERARLYCPTKCPALLLESTLNIKPKFRGVKGVDKADLEDPGARRAGNAAPAAGSCACSDKSSDDDLEWSTEDDENGDQVVVLPPEDASAFVLPPQDASAFALGAMTEEARVWDKSAIRDAGLCSFSVEIECCGSVHKIEVRHALAA